MIRSWNEGCKDCNSAECWICRVADERRAYHSLNLLLSVNNISGIQVLRAVESLDSSRREFNLGTPAI